MVILYRVPWLTYWLARCVIRVPWIGLVNIVAGRRIAANPFLYRRRGRYVTDLRRYAELFGRDRMHVVLFEDIVGSRPAVAALYGFLGVDGGFVPPDLGSVINAGTADRVALPEVLRRTLAAEFAPWNEALAEEFGLDLSP